MKLLLLSILLISTLLVSAQYNELVLKKNGWPKSRYREGSNITIETKLGMNYTGTIYLIQKDSIYFDGSGIAVSDIVAVRKKPYRKKPFIPYSKDMFLYANAGIPLFVAGLAISGQSLSSSIVAGFAIVYLPVLIYNAQRLLFSGSKVYNIGDTYQLQVLDFFTSENVPLNKQ